MSAAVLVESTSDVVSAGRVGALVATRETLPVGPDASRRRELDAVAADIEGAAEGLGIVLLLALFAVVFTVAALTGVLA